MKRDKKSPPKGEAQTLISYLPIQQELLYRGNHQP